MNAASRKFLGAFDAVGDRLALVFDGGIRVTYAELDARIAQIARQLRADWQLVAIEMAPSLHSIAALLACLRAGVAVALLPAEPGQALASLRSRFSPDALFARQAGRWRFTEEADRLEAPVHPDLALILVTSGSTGEGKAVRLSLSALAANAAQIVAALGISPADRAMVTLPLSYAYGLSVLLSHLHAGASLYFPSRSILEDGFDAAMTAAEPTNLPGVPFTFDLLERAGLDHSLPPSLRFATVAGGRMDPEKALAWRDRLALRDGQFFIMYGASEATARMSVADLRTGSGAEGSIGLPVPGGTFEIVDGEGRSVREAGCPGELCYRGPNLMMGYAMTRPDLARGQEIDRLLTGDLAFQRPDGLFELVGRKSRFSKIAGVRIGHDALEAALARRGLSAVVTGDDRMITCHHEAGDGEDYLHALASLTGLGRNQLRARRVAIIPRLPSGKVDYAALTTAPAQKARPSVDVATLFADSFYPHPVSAGDSFASLGGDSLKHVEISLGLERRLHHIPPGWERLTIRELCALSPRTGAMAPDLSSELLVRALAILLVVTQHATLWPIPGGAAAMTVLVGFAMARFQLPLLAEGKIRAFFRPLLRVLIPYYLILAGYALAWGTVPWASVFLVGNFGFADPARQTMLPYLYWFVEAYTQILLVVAGLFLLRPVRRLARENPFRLALAALTAAVLLRLAIPLFLDIGNRKLFTLYWILPLVLFGWSAAIAGTARQRHIIAALAMLVMPVLALQGGNWTGSWVKYLLQVCVILLLLYRPAFPVPEPLRRPILTIAHASFHIYLLHRLVPEVLMRPAENIMPSGLFAALAIIGGILLGLLSARLQAVFVRALRKQGPPERAQALPHNLGLSTP